MLEKEQNFSLKYFKISEKKINNKNFTNNHKYICEITLKDKFEQAIGG